MSEVLITGAGGLIGTLLLDGLSGRDGLRGIDRVRVGSPSVRRADMTKLRSVEKAFRGVEAVIDLAASSASETSWSDVRKNNIPATMNALEAARRAGIRRYIFASSNHVTGLYERDEPYAAIVAGDYGDLDPAEIPPITAGAPIRPDGPYAVGKVLGEAAVRYYAETYGFSAICLRIGTVNAEDCPQRPRHFATLLTHADLVRLVDCALRAPNTPRFAVYYGVSANRWRFWEVGEAERGIGFVPRDDAELFRAGA